MKRAVTLLVLVTLLTPHPAHAYLHLTFSVGTSQTPLKWDVPQVRWFATERSVPGVDSVS